VDDEINKALAGASTPKVDDSLAQLKAKMGMQ
jgi:phage shock protein A